MESITQFVLKNEISQFAQNLTWNIVLKLFFLSHLCNVLIIEIQIKCKQIEYTN